MRKSGTLARQALLVRVGRRPSDPNRGDTGRGATATRSEVLYTSSDVVPYSYSRGRTITTSPLIPAAPAPVIEASAEASLIDASEHISLLPGEHTLARKASFALVNACTLASLALGLLAIFLAMQAEVRFAAVCLVACVIFDGIDGALARKLGVSSPFGAQMDSLADMCSFGLAAPVVVYASLAGTVPPAAAGIAAALVAGCAAIRLARFNVSPKDGTFFCGVPTTMAAAVLALAVLIDLPIPGAVLLGGLALLAFAMVSSFPYAKLAKLIKMPPWLWLVPIVGALIDPRLTFALVVFAYLASGPLLWLRTRRV